MFCFSVIRRNTLADIPSTLLDEIKRLRELLLAMRTLMLSHSRAWTIYIESSQAQLEERILRDTRQDSELKTREDLSLWIRWRRGEDEVKVDYP